MHELVSPAINFTILVAFLVYVLRKPVKEMVVTRHNVIKTQVEEARAQKLEAERRFQEFDRKLKAFESEAAEILSRAKRDGEEMQARILANARGAADRILKEAEANAEAAKQEYRDQTRREAIGQAVELAEKMIREKLSSEDQRRIVHEYVGKVQ